MALPIPDRSKVYFRETYVTPPTPYGTKNAYDLTLYRELGTTDRGVLEVAVLIQYKFQDGNFAWTADEKEKYATDFAQTIYDVWDNRFRIKSTNDNAELKDIGVVFQLSHYTDGWAISEHWELKVDKLDPDNPDAWKQSAVTMQTGVGDMDSGDTKPVNKGASVGQRAAAHEFGHCLGLKDEYPTANGNPNYTGDTESIMHNGETVRARHYAGFADWLTKQFEYNDVNRGLRSLGYDPIAYKVNGSVDLFNARL